jgi:hypothetical protein
LVDWMWYPGAVPSRHTAPRAVAALSRMVVVQPSCEAGGAGGGAAASDVLMRTQSADVNIAEATAVHMPISRCRR